ncbi:XRE family transcriptional regulator [bacterium]|nr:XRE family transcriptional regulator [bacterium]
MNTLGRYIRLIRNQRGLSLVEVAYKVGIHYGVLQKIESGAMKTYPDRQVLKRLADVLGVRYSDLVNLIYEFRAVDDADRPDGKLIQLAPILDWAVVPEILKSKVIPVNVSAPRVGVDIDRLFGLGITTDRWEPWLFAGSVIFIDPNIRVLTHGTMNVIWDDTRRVVELYRAETIAGHCILHNLDRNGEALYGDRLLDRRIVGQVREISIDKL